MVISTGATSGSTITVISTKSRKNPSTKISAMQKISAPTGPPGIAVRIASIRSSPPRPMNTSENMLAVRMVAKIIAVTVIVAVIAGRSIARACALASDAAIVAAPNSASAA